MEALEFREIGRYLLSLVTGRDSLYLEPEASYPFIPDTSWWCRVRTGGAAPSGPWWDAGRAASPSRAARAARAGKGCASGAIKVAFRP